MPITLRDGKNDLSAAKVKSLSAPAARGSSRRAGMIFFAIFFLIGATFLFFFVKVVVVRSVRARSWPTVPCVVVSSAVGSHRGNSNSTSYSIDIVYSYTINGHAYQSKRYNAGLNGSSGGYDAKRAIVNRYRPGTKALCYVDPNNPSEAILDNNYSWTLLVGLLPLFFVLIGAAGFINVARGGGAAARQRALFSGSSDVTPVAPGAYRAVTSANASANVPLTLSPQQSPRQKLIGITIIALFWNGIVSIFLTVMIGSWRHGRPDACGLVFMIPFVAVGVGFIVGIVYSALAMFNPHIRITINRAELRLGETAEAKWEFSGRYDRVSSLHMTLEGREEATYRQGKSNTTDKEVFASIPIVETSKDLDIRSGKRTFTVPSDSMHSFEATNNKIVWVIRVHGEIPNWPDVKEDFSLMIRPMARETVMIDTLTIQTDAAGGVVRPEAIVRGVASWTLEKPARSIAIRLFWYTRGKAATVAQIVDAVTVDQPAMAGNRSFEFHLPEGPYSFSGKLITLTWAIELVADPGARAERVEFVLSPHDHEIALNATSSLNES